MVMALEPDAPMLSASQSSAGWGSFIAPSSASPALPFYVPPPPTALGRGGWDPDVFYETLDFQIGNFVGTGDVQKSSPPTLSKS